MWWYRDQSKTESATTVEDTSGDPVVDVIRRALAGCRADPYALLAMSVLVDYRLELTGAEAVDGHSWQDAEHVVQKAVGGERPIRLYNRFARTIGDAYEERDDIPPAHVAALEDLRERILADDSVLALTRRDGGY